MTEKHHRLNEALALIGVIFEVIGSATGMPQQTTELSQPILTSANTYSESEGELAAIMGAQFSQIAVGGLMNYDQATNFYGDLLKFTSSFVNQNSPLSLALTTAQTQQLNEQLIPYAKDQLKKYPQLLDSYHLSASNLTNDDVKKVVQSISSKVELEQIGNEVSRQMQQTGDIIGDIYSSDVEVDKEVKVSQEDPPEKPVVKPID